MALARWQATITDNKGNVIDQPTIQVWDEATGLVAQLRNDRDGFVPRSNPFTPQPGSGGYVFFHVAGGAYKIRASFGAFSREWRYVAVGLAAEADEAGGGGGLANVVDDTSPQLGGDLDLNGHNISGSAFLELGEISAPSTPAANKLRVYAKDDGAGNTIVCTKDGAGVETQYGVGFIEGTFTPTVTFATPGTLSVSYAQQWGWYTRIGNRVSFHLFVQFTPTKGTASGNFRINGLPFADATGQVAPLYMSNPRIIDWQTGNLQIYPQLQPSTSQIEFRIAGDNSVSSGLTVSHIPDATVASFGVGGSYVVA